MPFYRTLTEPGLLDLEQRQAFANDVVDVHCDVTGAPRSFVHVLFVDDDSGELAEGQKVLVSSTIRHGRTDEQKNEIGERLAQLLHERVGIDADSVTVIPTDVNASYTMEGGKLLPEPGSPEEEEWKALGHTA